MLYPIDSIYWPLKKLLGHRGINFFLERLINSFGILDSFVRSIRVGITSNSYVHSDVLSYRVLQTCRIFFIILDSLLCVAFILLIAFLFYRLSIV